MVTRYLVRCHGCKKQLVLRIQVSSTMSPDDPGSVQPFVFACPNCEAGIRGKLHAVVGARQPNLVSEDFTVVVDGHEDPEDKAVTVATDLPVPLSLMRGRAGDVMLTPFIQMTSSLGIGATAGLMGRIGGVRSLRDEAFPSLRRAGLAFVRGDLAGVTRTLMDNEPAESHDFLAKLPPAVLLGMAFMRSYGPIEDEDLIEGARAELARTMEEAAKADSASLVGLLTALQAAGVTEHSNRVIDTALTLLGDVEPLIAGLCAEEMERAGRLDDHRVMRDDFDVLKSRYQDIFELGSRSLAFLARVANIARRGDVQLHVDGKKRSLKEAIDATAGAREPWLADFPVAKQMYDAVERHTRNEIGHRSVRYDFERGVLVYHDGVEENYLLFLVDYLGAVRLSHYLLEAAISFYRVAETASLVLGPNGSEGV
jgi:hypothetical protein